MNGLKTMMLLAALTALLMALGYTLGGPTGAIVALVVACGMNIFSWWNSDKIVLKMHDAREVGPETDLYQMVKQLADRAALPMPRVYVIDQPHPNAFATGRNPENAAVAATTGLLSMLSRDEVEGVMAHELAHVKNRDTLVMTVVATIAGAISMLANFSMFFRDSSGRTNPLASILAVIVAPLAAMIVQMAISRTREFGADKVGAEMSGKPMALASALAKISRGAEAIPNPVARSKPAVAQLYIVPAGISQMFSTHPATELRIEALQDLAEDMGQPPVSVPTASQPSARRSSALDPLG
jgi:heat shock protein HtpX